MEVELDRSQTLGAASLNGAFSGKVYDLGVIALILKIELPGADYDTIKQLAIFLENSGEEKCDVNDKIDKNIEDLFLTQLQSVVEILGPALIQPNQQFFVEDYKLFYFTQWHTDWDAVPILLGDAGPFSAQLRDDALRYTLSYSPQEITMITWDSAIVYDPTGNRDLPDLLEFAICQLLELRYYDHRLNQEMTKMYAEIEEAQRITQYRRFGQYRRIMKQMMELVMDINEVTERIQNSLKVTGMYITPVYWLPWTPFAPKLDGKSRAEDYPDSAKLQPAAQ